MNEIASLSLKFSSKMTSTYARVDMDKIHTYTPDFPWPRTNASTTVLGDKGPMGGTEWTVSALASCPPGPPTYVYGRGAAEPNQNGLMFVPPLDAPPACGSGPSCFQGYFSCLGFKIKVTDFNCGIFATPSLFIFVNVPLSYMHTYTLHLFVKKHRQTYTYGPESLGP